jgi:hypothetical protein
MREAVGAGNHKTVVTMVRAADALWDARGCHDPKVTAAMTKCSRSPAPTSGKKNDKRNGNACSKVFLLPAPTSFLFKIQTMGGANFTTSTATKHTSAFSRVSGQKTKTPANS